MYECARWMHVLKLVGLFKTRLILRLIFVFWCTDYKFFKILNLIFDICIVIFGILNFGFFSLNRSSSKSWNLKWEGGKFRVFLSVWPIFIKPSFLSNTLYDIIFILVSLFIIPIYSEFLSNDGTFNFHIRDFPCD